MSQYLTVTTFGGLNEGEQGIFPIQPGINPPGTNVLTLCENFRGSIDYASVAARTPTIGLVTKSPLSYSLSTMGTSGRARGMFHFLPTIGSATGSYLMVMLCTTDYSVSKLYAYDLANTWTQLRIQGAFDFTADHASFEQYQNKLFLTTPTGSFVKFHANWLSYGCPIVYDKGAGGTALAAATLTWNLTTTVTSDIDISGTLKPGMYIRRSSSSAYWDEISSIAGGGLTITLIAASSDTGASGAGASQYTGTGAFVTVGTPYFLKVFKEKMWAANNNAVATTKSYIYWSVTGDTENWTGTGAGYMTVGSSQGEQITGIESIEDLLFVFKDTCYYVYRWTGDVDAPIEEVRKFNYGCVSHATIKRIETGLFYASFGELRYTDGTNDVPLSRDMKTLNNSLMFRSASKFALTAADNTYPWAEIDTFKKLYMICIPSGSGNSTVYNYNYEEKKWEGTETYYDAGRGVIVDAGNSKLLTFAPMQVGNQLKQLNLTGGDFSTSGYLESLTFCTQSAAQKIKVNWVEFGVHPIYTASTINTNLLFNYRKDLGAISNSTQQSANINYTVAGGFATPYVVDPRRFYVNDTCKTFSWYLTESFGAGAADDIGLTYWTICYDITDGVF